VSYVNFGSAQARPSAVCSRVRRFRGRPPSEESKNDGGAQTSLPRLAVVESYGRTGVGLANLSHYYQLRSMEDGRFFYWKQTTGRARPKRQQHLSDIKEAI
jgi:hypothetical protein